MATTACPVRGRGRHLEPIDDAGVVADYEAGATLAAIEQSYDIGLTRLYRILDHHQVPRRRPRAEARQPCPSACVRRLPLRHAHR